MHSNVIKRNIQSHVIQRVTQPSRFSNSRIASLRFLSKHQIMKTTTLSRVLSQSQVRNKDMDG